MQARQQIIDQTLRDHEANTGGPDANSPIIHAELIKRLTVEAYLTCEDFAYFDVKCCDAACESEPHYEMIDVILADDRHAWVCCRIRNILIRRTKKAPSNDPEMEKTAKRWAKAFGRKSDPVEEQLHAANTAATSDEEKLLYCLKYADHKAGRKRGDKKLKALVQCALPLPGGRPAKGQSVSDPPRGCGLCLQCGAGIYEESFIPGTNFRNCRRIREQELQRQDKSANESTRPSEMRKGHAK
jgi:hypothetical protein